jgi:hypothetical protein
VDVRVESDVALPARLRPPPDEVSAWYERTLRMMGADVRRLGPTALEFDLPMPVALFDPDVRGSLAAFASGTVDVDATADGFSVEVRGRPRSWVAYSLLGVLGLVTSGIAFLPPALRIGLAVGGLPLFGAAWLETRWRLSRFVTATNREITESFAAVPPAPRPERIG